MVRILLGNEPRYASQPHQPRVGDRIDQSICQLWIDPAILVSPYDERRRLDLSVLVLIQIRAVYRARQGQQMVRAVFPDEGREIAGDELHRHVFGDRYAALQDAL